MSPLVPFFALAAAVWLIHLLRRGTVPLFGLIVLVAGTFFGPPFFAIDGPFQISVDRILWFCLIGFYLVQWRLGGTDPKKISRADWLLLAFVALTGISSQQGGTVPDGSSPLARWIFYIAMPAGMYVIARGAHIRNSDLRHISSGLVAVGVYLGFTALLETSGVHSLVFPRFIVDEEIWEFFGRGRGPLLNPTGNGVVLTVALGAAAIRWLGAGRAGKIGYGVATIVILVGCAATMTRCVWLGAIVLLGLIALHHSPRWLRVWTLAASILVAGGVGMLYQDQLLRLKRDEHLSASAAAKSVQLRPLLAIIALEMFKDRPLIGHGYGHYFEHNRPYTQIRDWEMPLQIADSYMQHNVVLSLLVDCGLIGASLLVGLLTWWTICGWHLYRRVTADSEARELGMLMVAFIVGYVANGMFQDVTVVPMIHMYLMFLAGLTMGAYARGGILTQPQAAKSPRSERRAADPGASPALA